MAGESTLSDLAARSFPSLLISVRFLKQPATGTALYEDRIVLLLLKDSRIADVKVLAELISQNLLTSMIK